MSQVQSRFNQRPTPYLLLHVPTATLTLCPVKLFCLFAGWGGPPPFDSAAGTWFGRAKSLAKGPFTLPQARLQTSFPALLACAGAVLASGPGKNRGKIKRKFKQATEYSGVLAWGPSFEPSNRRSLPHHRRRKDGETYFTLRVKLEAVTTHHQLRSFPLHV